jgi:hypothetical protein
MGNWREGKVEGGKQGLTALLARTSQKSCLIDELMRQQPPRVTLIRDSHAFRVPAVLRCCTPYLWSVAL